MNLKKDFPAFMRYYRGIPADGTGTYFPALEQINATVKRELCKLLALPDGVDTLEGKLFSDPKIKFKKTLEFIHQLVPTELTTTLSTDVITASILNNKLPDGRKMSRVLCAFPEDSVKSLSAQHSHVLRAVLLFPEFNKNISTELPKFPHCPWTTDAMLGAIKLIIQNFYSELAALTTTVCGFSTNIWKIYNAANSTAFQSCFNITRHMYARSATGVVVNPSYGVLYSKHGETVTGRAWAHITVNSISVYPTYGFISPETITFICSNLAGRINHTQNNTDTKWNMHTEFSSSAVSRVRNVIAGYSDDVACLFTSLKIPCNSHTSDVYAPCVMCGKNVISQPQMGPHVHKDLLCSTCANAFKTCVKCGNKYLAIATQVKGMCTECESSLVLCEKCGTSFARETGQCYKCAWENRCTFCGEVTADLLVCDTGAICTTCRQALTQNKCDCCGVLQFTYPLCKTAVCDRCYSTIQIFLCSPQDLRVQRSSPYLQQVIKFCTNHDIIRREHEKSNLST